MSDQSIRIQIARCVGDTWEVRLIGPGGWRTTCSRVNLSEARHDARATATVLRCQIEEEPTQ